MLAKKNRLKKKKDFENVFKKGRSFKEGFLVLKIVDNKSDKIRFGFIISQKISKKASHRNKIKRQISEIIRLKMKKIKKGVDGVLITLPGIEEKNFSEIKENIDKLFKKARVQIL